MLRKFSVMAVGRSRGKNAVRAGHYKDLTETGNRARKVSGTQGRKPSTPERFMGYNFIVLKGKAYRYEKF